MGLAARKWAPHQEMGQRAQLRAPIHVRVDLFAKHAVATGLTMNVSEGGVFVATPDALPIGSVAVLHMTLPFVKEAIVTLAEVRWARAYSIDEGAPAGLGLMFLDTDAKATMQIRELVALMSDAELDANGE